MRSFVFLLLLLCAGGLKSQSLGIYYTQHSRGGFGDLGVAISYKKVDFMIGKDIPYPSIGTQVDKDPVYIYSGYNLYKDFWAYFRYGYGQYFPDDPIISTYGFIVRHNPVYFGYQFDVGHTVFEVRINLYSRDRSLNKNLSSRIRS